MNKLIPISLVIIGFIFNPFSSRSEIKLSGSHPSINEDYVKYDNILIDSLDYFTFKDGEIINMKIAIDDCIKESEESNGDLIDAKGYCFCSFTNICKYYTFNEFVSLFSSEDVYENAFNFIHTEIGSKIVSECMKDFINVDSNVPYPNDIKKIALMQCKYNVQNSKELNGLVDEDKYCNCFVDNIMKQFTYPEIYKIFMQETITDSRYIKLTNDCLEGSFK